MRPGSLAALGVFVDLEALLETILSAIHKLEAVRLEPQAVTRKNAAKLLDMSTKTLDRRIAAGLICCCDGGRRIPLSEIRRFVSSLEKPERVPRKLRKPSSYSAGEEAEEAARLLKRR
jgi:hypothetical protein